MNHHSVAAGDDRGGTHEQEGFEPASPRPATAVASAASGLQDGSSRGMSKLPMEPPVRSPATSPHSTGRARVDLSTELLVLPDGRILVHNLTPTFAGLLNELNPADDAVKLRGREP
jgi:hypothetical protein